MKRHYILYTILFAIIYPVTLWADNYVIINQIMYDSPLNEHVIEPPYSNGEFLELYNGSENAVSLQGWYITGESPTEHFDFPDISIASKGFLTIAFRHEDSPSFALGGVFDLPIENPDFHLIYQHNVILANHGETISLYNANDEIVDQIYYDGNSHTTKPDRLSADNEDGTPGNRCVSLHRTWVEFDENGLVVLGTSQFKTGLVTFNSCQLAETSFGEHSITGTHSLPTGENYILSVTPLDPTTRVSISNDGVSVSNGVRTQTSIMYYDGLGRPVENILIGVNPSKSDLLTITDYNGLHSAVKQWLPVSLHAEGDFTDVSDIKTLAQTYYSDNRPFAETLYEYSALERVIGHKQPGSAWENHPSSNTYSINDASDNVRIYSVGNNGALKTTGENYNAATLYKTIVADEDGKSVTTFIDKLGRTIMEERAGNRTYYVYDNVGHLRFVLPHIPSSKLSDGEYTLSDSTLRRAAYCYMYDTSGNLIYKRLPGCEAQYMIYDKARQLILSQDGNQRPFKKWTLYTYDSIGRNLYTAEVFSMEEYEHLMSHFAEIWYVEHYGNNPSSTSISGTGYASSFFPKRDVHLLTVNYYDDYHYITRFDTPVSQKLRFKQESGYGLQYENATGMLTGTRIYSLAEKGDYTVTSYYYDTKGRVVQSRSAHNTNGHRTATSTEYLFDGSIAQQLSIQGTDSSLVREHYRYDYDHAGRVKQTYYKLNNEEEILLSAFSYDSIGRLAQNLLHNKRDAITYAYDIRNMLTGTHNKHFSERLYYADSVSQIANATPCHNGNISVARISSADSIYLFAYTYDPLNRLLQSKRLTGYGSINSEIFSYDDAGNIQTLKRFNNNSLIDDLDYDYGNAGNQLLAITDRGVNADRYNIIEYHNGNSQADTTMRYDANGNLVYDVDREISVISYNILNLPDTIQFINGNQIVNLYDATGHKFKSILYTLVPTVVTTHYAIEPYTFETDSVVFSITEYNGNIETVCSLESDTTQRIHNTIGYYSDGVYYHYIKDHLGNVCAVVNSEADTLIQSTIYYASGVPMAYSFGRDKQPYLYNGKEFVEAHGLNTYDYGFRGYYAPIGRFTSIDPLAEQTPWQSPYSYAGNNFINAIDWMGLGGLTSGYTSSYGWMAQDAEGNVVGWGEDNNDWRVYEVDKYWDGTYAGLEGHSQFLGWEIFDRNGNRPSYIKGQKTYYVGSVQYSYYIHGETYIVAKKVLKYGNNTVNTALTIDNNVEAIIHYYLGLGISVQNGDNAIRKFMLTPEYQSIFTSISNGQTHGYGTIDMKEHIFHIGKTGYSFHVNGNMIVIGFALNDGFGDPDYISEKLCKKIGYDLTDGKGPNLEYGGFPYDYIPSVIIVWK